MRGNKGFIRRCAATSAALLTVAGIAGCGTGSNASGNPTQAKTVRIGVLQPLSGAYADSGKDIKHAYDLAAKQFNDAGGIKAMGGAKVELVYADLQSKPDVARSAAEKFGLDKSISALATGYPSPLSLVTTEVAEKHKLPIVVDNGIDDRMTERGFKYTFRVGVRSMDFGQAMVNFLVDAYHPKSMALVYADTSSFQATAKAVRETAKAKGLNIVMDESYGQDATDLTPVAQKIKRAAPDVLAAASYDPDAIRLSQSLSEQGVKIKGLVGAGGGHSTVGLITALGKLSEGVASAGVWATDLKTNDISTKFIADYKAAYSEEPNQIGGVSFATMSVLLSAIDKAGSADREQIAAALRTSDLDTILGHLKFDAKGQADSKAIVVQVQNGKFTTVWPSDRATSGPLLLP